MNMRKLNFILLVGIGFLLINAALNLSLAAGSDYTSSNDSYSQKQGNFAGDYYYSYSWYNESFPAWEYQDEYSYWELLWLNNGTEDTWVLVVIDYNLTIKDSGNLSYLYFEIYDDPDGSMLTNYENNWTEFESMDWEGYDDYYVDENADIYGWDENSTDSGADSGSNSWLDGWNIEDDNATMVEDDSSEMTVDESNPDYSSVEESLTGDEGLWFIDVYFEEWETEYDGSINYTWYNVQYNDYGEIILGSLLDPASLGPASTSPYDDLGEEYDDWYWYVDWDWEWAQMMMENESYDHKSYSLTWFSYDIGQWVSFYDNTTDQYTFLSQYVGYIGMSLFEDTNGNGVVDVSYNNETADIWNDDVWMMIAEDDSSEIPDNSVPYEMNESISEERYLLTLDSVGSVEWGIPQINENNAEFWICLKDIEFLAVPYATDFNWFMDDENTGDLSISSKVDYLNVSFSFQSDETGSSVAVKHDISDFTDDTANRNPITQFENLSMTIDYSVYIDQYTENMANYYYDDALDSETATLFEGESLNSAVPIDENVSIESHNKNLMEIDYTMPYTWGKDGQEYENTVAITPIYGYQWMYSDAEVGQASSFGYESNSYIYSMCFNWEGYAITMDPTFMSFYVDFNSDEGKMSIIQIGSIALMSVLAGFGLVVVLKKAKIK